MMLIIISPHYAATPLMPLTLMRHAIFAADDFQLSA
jgi:hypothetical protein